MSIGKTVNVHMCNLQKKMCNTDVCYVLFRWDVAWGKKLMNNKLNSDNKMSIIKWLIKKNNIHLK